MTLTNQKFIYQMFEEQARQRSGHTAAADIAEDRFITYEELSRQSGQWAMQLKDSGMKAGDIAVLHLDSPVDTAAAVLGVLKAGGTCLPLHHSYPFKYTDNILRYSKANYLLTTERYKNTFEFEGKILLYNDSIPYDAFCAPYTYPGEGSENPSFLIYSSLSHSTGRPGGILLSQKKITDWITFNCETLGVDFTNTLFISEPFIDMSFPLWLANLVTGGTVYFYKPPDEEPLDISQLTSAGHREKFKSIACSLFFLRRFVSQNAYLRMPAADIANIVTAGDETFDADEFKKFIKEKKIKWHNYYGFPQVNMITTLVPDTASSTGGFKHMGKPGIETRAYILNREGGIVTVGITGELYVSGDGVLSRYHRNEPLNRSLFVKNPLVPGTKIYKTGYKTSWQADGRLSFFGRTDNQVSLNGRPTAMEEIEAALFRHPLMEACAAVLKNNAKGVPLPMAYVVLKEDIAVEQLKEHLEIYLPPEPLPLLGFIKLLQLPRLADGTVDRKYLERIDLMDICRIRRLEEELRKEPGINQVAITASEKIESPSPLHVMDFLPRAGAGTSPGPANFTGGAEDSRDSSVEEKKKRTIPGKDEDDKTSLALIKGQEIKREEGDPQILADLLKRAATQDGENGILYIHSDGSEHFQGYKDLMQEAQQVLAGLRHRGLKAGDKIIFQFNRDEDYTAAFWGSQLGGMVPVPIMVPRSFNEPTNETAMLYNVWETLDRPIILTDESLEESLTLLPGYYDFDPSKVVTIETLREHEPDHQWHQGSTDDLALLLFTSGSTGVPKGVMQPHRTILAREKGTILHNDFDSSDVSMNWMPLEHVGGVVMFHVRDVYCCCSQVQVRTDYILSSPLRWLDIIDKHRVTITWAPNFAYGLVNEQMEQLKTSGVEKHWDLSSMKFILNGGEAVNAVTVKGFLNRLAPFGLSGDAMKPAWGMSETCSGVVYSHALTPEPGTGILHIDKHSLTHRVKKSTSEADNVIFVELGRTIPGISVRAADSNNQVIMEGRVGRLQIKGSTVTTGYYNNPELNREVFTPDGWFDTGDMGFILNGKMTITGRAKDVIIIHGINYNNIEIESIVEGVEGVESSYTAACAARDPYSDTEKIIIFYSSAYTDLDFDRKLEQIKKIEKKMVEKMGIKPDLVIPVSREEIPKTSIGKIQRLKLGESFEKGHFDDIVKQVDIGLENENTLPQWFFRQRWSPSPLPAPAVEEEMKGRSRWCLVFEDDLGLAHTLVRELTEYDKYEDCLSITIKAGRTFKKVDPLCYEIDFSNPSDYKRILEELSENNKKFQILDIFHLRGYGEIKGTTHSWTVPVEEIEKNIKSSLDNGIYSLLNLIQALDSIWGQGEKSRPLTRLFIVTSHTHAAVENDPLSYEKSGLSGFLKSVALELPWLTCSHIDLGAGPPRIDAQAIVREWKNPSNSIEVVYREGSRMIPLLDRVDMGKTGIEDIPLKKDGLYLVTGGLGGIGTLVSRWLMANYAAKLIIVGRTSLPSRDRWDDVLKENTTLSKRISAYLDIETVSSDFIYKPGDIAIETFLQGVAKEAETRWNKALDGIFHLAGLGNLEYHWKVMEERWVTTETRHHFESIFRAKVYGTLRLHRLIKENPKAIFAAFSSSTAVFGSPTFSAYAAANSFLNGFCLFRQSVGYPNTYCLSWSAWDNVGMSENNAAPMVKAMVQNGYRLISPTQGMNSLFLALNSKYRHLIIGLDSTNRNIRKNMDEYPPDQQELNIYYSVGNEKDFSVTRFQKHASDILLKQYKRKPPLPIFFPLDTLPETDNGTIDYNQLEAVDKRGRVSTDALDMPETPSEKTLARIWKELLGKSRVGSNDNFFELGGNSLKATIMASRVHKELDVNISLGDVFQFPTVKGIAEYIDTMSKEKYTSIRPLGKQEAYELSSAQKRLYVVNRLVPQSTAYNLPEARLLEGSLDRQRLETAFKKLIARHESFRTGFVMKDNEPVQGIYHNVAFNIEYFDLSDASTEAEIKEQIHRFEKPFDLSQPPLLRVWLIKIASDKHILLTDIHHIITDGLSQWIFIHEVKALYTGMEIPGLPIRYVDFAHWQNRQLQMGKMKQQEDFWFRQFEGEIPVLELPIDFPRPRVQDFIGRELIFFIGREETFALKQLASDTDTTLFMVMLAIYYLFLSKLSGQGDIVIGTGIAGRRHADLEPIIGMFVNTLALRDFPAPCENFLGFLKGVREHVLEAFENQDYQFEDLVDKLDLYRDMGRNPLFDAMFAFQNLDALSQGMPEVNIPDLEIKPYDYEVGISMFDLTLVVEEAVEQKALTLHMEYSTRLFKAETIERFAYYYRRILSTVLENPNVKLSEIEITSPQEKKKILYDFNDTGTDYPSDTTIHQLFREQAERAGDKIAVVSMESVSYKELNEKSDQLAALLIKKGVVSGDIVGIMVERSVEMAIGVLAILKAGGAYLPIDLDYPEGRKQYMLADSSAGILLTTHHSSGGFSFEKEIIYLENDKKTAASPESSLHASPAGSSSLAYIIYTSGSTGQPKGVMVEHRNVVRLVKNTDYVPFSEKLRILQTGALEFDASTFEIWGALLNGGRLYLVGKDEIVDHRQLKSAIEGYNINTLWMTSPLFNQMSLADIEIFRGLKYLLVGGDVLSPGHINRVRHRYPELTVINGYGPTENTTFSTTFRIGRDYAEKIPIGSPIANSTVYILDAGDNLVPIGIPGELVVGGDGVARGYLNNPDLTNDKFIENPYLLPMTNDQCPMTVFYRTGDLARWLPDGNIEFLGRVDQQVKIRGYRIEPEEIEAQLLKHENIKEAVVTTGVERSNTDEKLLYAYIVPQSPSDLEPALRDSLSRKLPGYMVPSQFVILDKIPLTPNGKVNRKSLPEPKPGIDTDACYSAPQNRIESLLVRFWAEILGIEKDRISIDADFFKLGGHSLRATGLISRILKEFNVHVPMTRIFQSPSIREMAQFIKTAQKVNDTLIPVTTGKKCFPLSSIQKRFFILDSIDGVDTAFNLPLVMMVEGKPGIQRLERAFQLMIQRHESLRTSFELREGEPVQIVHERVDFFIEHLEADERDLQEMIVEFITPFDLSKAPLLRVKLVKFSQEKHLLFIETHHIMSDGTSQVILMEDLLRFYEGKEPPPLRIQYKDFVEWQKSPAGRTAIAKQEEYWLDRFKGTLPDLDIYMDYPRPPVQSFEGSQVDFSFEEALYGKIRQLMRRTGTTLYMVILAALNVLLHKYTGQEDIVIGTAVAGRDNVDVENILGVFINALAMRNQPEAGKTFEEFLSEVKENTLNAFENQGYPFDDLIENVEFKKDISRNPLYDVDFVLLNMEAPRLEVEGLTFVPLAYESKVTQMDIAFYAVDTENRIDFKLLYCTALFKRATMERVITYFKEVVSAVVENSSIKLKDIEVSYKLEVTKSNVYDDMAEELEF